MIAKFTKSTFFLFLISVFSISSFAQTKNQKPKLNQVGFYPQSSKIAIVPDIDASVFYLRNTDNGSVVYEGNLTSGGFYSQSNESVKVADFTNFIFSGNYVLGVEGGEESFEFTIGNNVFSELSDGILKAFYFNRASTALEEEFAGPWARALGHPDTVVVVHNSAASENRPANSTFSSPKGWYDAGDFGKYVVPISSSISQLLFSYEEFPEFFAAQDLNIPESDNAIPDILDESLWALRWLLTMQDPDDGGVYHKLTTSSFVGTVMPSGNNNTRYVVQKGTGATYDFAAVMAQAARVYESFLPDFADSALVASKAAWAWGLANPNVAYNQGSLSAPTISTGAYGDNGNFSDEKFWASSELYITTKDDSYYMDNGWNSAGAVGWNSVRGLGLFSMVANRENLTAVGLSDTTSMKQRVKNIADSYVNPSSSAPYRSPFGTNSGHFFWGSNGFAGNIGLATMLAYRTTGDEKYYKASIDVLDYLMGRNALDQSYVTGFGDRPPLAIHHRQSQADQVAAPVPGWVAGGANPSNQSQDCGVGAYSSTLPALSYLDDYCSYSTNEITTYWNSPFIYILAGLEFLTPEFSAENSKTGFFNSPNFDPLYLPGDTVSLAWTLVNIDTINLYYKVGADSDFTLLAENRASNNSIYSDFVVPNRPGESIVFRIEDSEDPTVWFKSSFLMIKPSKSIGFKSIETSADFTPGKRVVISWETVSIDSIDIYYRLASQTDYTLIKDNRKATDGQYSRFTVPDAIGDSFIIRLVDSKADSVFFDSEPILIVSLVSNENENTLVTEFNLSQNYPNPFNPTTTIDFTIAESGKVRLSVFNLMGQQVAELVNENKSSGTHSVIWDATGAASGTYYYRLEAGNKTLTQKMMLIK